MEIDEPIEAEYRRLKEEQTRLIALTTSKSRLTMRWSQRRPPCL
jgi:hypothetical protein